MKNIPVFTIAVLALVLVLLASCQTQTSTPLASEVPPQSEGATQPAIANPASQYCLDQGGTLAIEERGDGGQIGVCYFEDNRQCEEWALMRGECPVGGIKVTGYITPAARYCAITGGEYAITGNNGADDEQGTCTFEDGSQCNAWDYYNGVCTPGAATSPSEPAIEWQPYTNTEVGFSLQAPSTWSQGTLPDQNDGAIHGEGFSGPEGGVEVYWGVGFGGACPTGTEPVQLAQGEVEACHATQSDGTEEWSQIGYEVEGGNSFSVRAYTNDSQPSSRELVLQVLASLTFSQQTEPKPEAAGSGKWYVSQEVGYAIQAPLTWREQTLPDQNQGAIHGMSYSGAEGGVEVYWGKGFGGACPTGTDPVMLAAGEFQSCHIKKDDGTQEWNQIGYEVEGGNSFSVRAYTSDPQPSSQDLVLRALSTVTFRMPVTGTIKPLTMEVCDGQAQAMSHTLDDLVPTQSEELLDDYINNAWGTGCQATITGSGADFESPWAVVDELGGMLEEQGWTMDPMLGADLPTGTAMGYRMGDQICSAGAMWTPDASANCPKDQPIPECDLTPEQQIYTVTLNCGVEVSEEQISSDVGSNLLVFDSTRGGDYRDLYLMNSDGYDMSRLTRGEANSFAGPWSPDGQRIAFTTLGLTNSYIAMINADGSGQTTLSAIEGSDEAFPDWSPDGTRIAFTSRRDGNNEIYLLNADGLNPVRLTNAPGDDFAPSWSPDGTQIAFVSDRDQEAGIYDLYIMNANGSGVARLTNDPAIDYSPDWSPDGQMIVFRSDQDGESDIFVINVDGSGRTNLTNNPGYDWAPQWSPDGSQIAFQTNRDGTWEIYRMAADGSDPVNLTNDPADDQLPYWQP